MMADLKEARQLVDELFRSMEEHKRPCDITITITVSEHQELPTTWLDFAERYLPSRLRVKDYRGLSIELYAMEQCGLNRYIYAPSYPKLATLLSSICGWTLSPRSIAQRIDDLDIHQDQSELALALAFWKKMTGSSQSVQIGSYETK